MKPRSPNLPLSLSVVSVDCRSPGCMKSPEIAIHGAGYPLPGGYDDTRQSRFVEIFSYAFLEGAAKIISLFLDGRKGFRKFRETNIQCHRWYSKTIPGASIPAVHLCSVGYAGTTVFKMESVFSQNLKKFLVVSCFAFLAACSNQHIENSPEGDNLKNELYKQFSEWRSVRYRLGGLTKAGIDCSGFVYLTYRDIWNIQLPRTTGQQLYSGRFVSKSDLRVGDLVFFNTGKRQRHVGIYLEQRQFLHVSTRKGVTISRLDNPYWRQRYRQAVRVLDS